VNSDDCPRGDYPGERNAHDWAHTTDARTCRRCGLHESYGGGSCMGHHDTYWTGYNSDTRVCRRCGWRETQADRDPHGGAGW